MTRAKQTSSQHAADEQRYLATRTRHTSRQAPVTHPCSPRSRKGGATILTVIVDDDELFRAGVAHLLDGEGFRIIFDGGRLDDLSAEKFHDSDAVVVIGLGRDPKVGLSKLSLLSRTCKRLRIAVLSDTFRLEEMITAIKAGARGYFIKGSTSPEVLLKSLELMCLGRIVLPGEFSEALRHCSELDSDASPGAESGGMVLQGQQVMAPLEALPLGSFSKLSNREQMILRQLTEGATNKHIARNLTIAEATVKVHLKSLLRKIHVSNRTQAAMWARDHLPEGCEPMAKRVEDLRPGFLMDSSIKAGAVLPAANAKAGPELLHHKPLALASVPAGTAGLRPGPR